MMVTDDAAKERHRYCCCHHHAMMTFDLRFDSPVRTSHELLLHAITHFHSIVNAHTHTRRDDTLVQRERLLPSPLILASAVVVTVT